MSTENKDRSYFSAGPNRARSKRSSAAEVQSLDVPVEASEDQPASLAEAISPDDLARRTGAAPLDRLKSVAQTESFTHALESMPPDLRTVFGASSDRPVFIPTEDGLGEIDCDRFPLAQSYDDVIPASHPHSGGEMRMCGTRPRRSRYGSLPYAEPMPKTDLIPRTQWTDIIRETRPRQSAIRRRRRLIRSWPRRR
jgi:hypothetical protein